MLDGRNRDDVLEPVRACDSDHDDDLEHAGDPSSDVLGRHLGNVGRADDRHDSNSESGDDSTGVHGGEVVHGHGLSDGSDQEDEGSDKETVLASELAADVSSAEGSEEGSDLEERDDVGGDVGNLLLGLVGEPKVIGERLGVDD